MRMLAIGFAAVLGAALVAHGEAAEKGKPAGQGTGLGSWSKADGLDVGGKKKKKLKAKGGTKGEGGNSPSGSRWWKSRSGHQLD